MTSEQREKRAERNRRYYQRRRSADQVDEMGSERLNGEDGELRRHLTPPSLSEASEINTAGNCAPDGSSIKTVGLTASSDNRPLSGIGNNLPEYEQVIAEWSSIKMHKTLESSDGKTRVQNQSGRLTFLRRPQIASLLLSLSLVSTITFCLVNEAYRYYMQHDPTMAFLKALVGEMILLYLALLVPRKWVHRILVKGLLAITFGYLVWIISMGLVLQASGDVNKTTQINSMIGEVKRQIEDKRGELSELTKSGWISRARKVDEQLTGDQQRLFDLRSRLAEIGGDQRELIVSNLVSQVLFRVILMFTNIVLMRNLRRVCGVSWNSAVTNRDPSACC